MSHRVMKATVSAYIDALIGWGDQLFRRDTHESGNDAAGLYLRAAKLLGTRTRSRASGRSVRLRVSAADRPADPFDQLSEQEKRWWCFWELLGAPGAGRFKPVDVRSVEEWTAGSVPESINVPLDDIDTLPTKLRTRTSLFIFGSTEEETERAVAAVQRLGYRDVIAPPGGYEEMERQHRS